MLEKLFTGIFESGSTAATQSISLTPFLICMASSLLIGSLMALAYKHKTRCSQSFVITLAILPAAIAMVIMLVNGNVGAGVAVAGAFGLVRFRSVPGTAKEIGAIFTAMAAGLACGIVTARHTSGSTSRFRRIWIIPISLTISLPATPGAIGLSPSRPPIWAVSSS